jgi:hypothetical protein
MVLLALERVFFACVEFMKKKLARHELCGRWCLRVQVSMIAKHIMRWLPTLWGTKAVSIV